MQENKSLDIKDIITVIPSIIESQADYIKLLEYQANTLLKSALLNKQTILEIEEKYINDNTINTDNYLDQRNKFFQNMNEYFKSIQFIEESKQLTNEH